MVNLMTESVKKWLDEHPKVQAYVTRHEYESLKRLAETMGLSMSELVKKAILSLKGVEGRSVRERLR